MKINSEVYDKVIDSVNVIVNGNLPVGMVFDKKDSVETNLNLNLTKLGMDSLDIIELSLEIEDVLLITLPMGVDKNWVTIRNVYESALSAVCDD